MNKVIIALFICCTSYSFGMQQMSYAEMKSCIRRSIAEDLYDGNVVNFNADSFCDQSRSLSRNVLAGEERHVSVPAVVFTAVRRSRESIDSARREQDVAELIRGIEYLESLPRQVGTVYNNVFVIKATGFDEENRGTFVDVEELWPSNV